MAAPTFVGETEVGFAVTTALSKTSGTITYDAGDVLVVLGAMENEIRTLSISSSAGLTWTLQQSIGVTDYCRIYVWTAIPGSGGSTTVTVSNSSSGTWAYGCNILQFRDSDGIGNSSKANVDESPGPSLALTTAGADSAVCVINADWDAVDGSSRTWREADAGTISEQSYERDAARYTVYTGYHADAGSAAAKTLGLSAPTGQKYAISAVEVLGSTDPPPDMQPPCVPDADVTTTGWTATPLFSKVNDASDGTVITGALT